MAATILSQDNRVRPKVYGGKKDENNVLGVLTSQKETDTKSNKTQGIGKTYKREICHKRTDTNCAALCIGMPT